MMVNSDTKPDQIQLDYIESGKARLLVHWDITQVEQTDPNTGATRTGYNYSEKVIWWVLPRKYNTLAEIQDYLISVSAEILDWAKAAELDMSGAPLNQPLPVAEMAKRVHDMAVAALNTEYVPQFEALQGAYMAALILGDSATMTANRETYQALLTEYNAKLEAIQ